MPLDVVVDNCQGCGAPLPADGICTFCGNTVERDDSMAREQASRREAEALFATLGQPPTWWQKVAVALTNPWLWLLGFPFLLGILHWLSSIPADAVAALYERIGHARMLHVTPPWLAWLVDNLWSAGIAIALLVLSLFGERVDARRELQAALACKPPRTEGGPARCRNCDAALTVPEGALGVRCAACGADNLVRVPPEWTARAAKIAHTLKLSEEVARQRAAVGRRQVRRAAMWRVPMVLLIVAFLILPSWNKRSNARWAEFRDPELVLDLVEIWKHGNSPARDLRVVPRCELDAKKRARLAPQAKLVSTDSAWCEWQNGQLCQLLVLLPLAAGERVQLDSDGPINPKLELGPRWYTGGLDLSEFFGDAVPLDRPVAISGWYRLTVLARPGTTIQPCVATR